MKFVTLFFGTITVSAVLLSVAALSGVRVNTSPSMPKGLWLEIPYDPAKPLHAGDVVAVCLEPTPETKRFVGPGSCANGLEPVLKTVGAAPGDIVEVTDTAVTVNHGSAYLILPALPGCPVGTYPVQPKQVWLLSDHTPLSYDSRYFCWLDHSKIVHQGKPLLVGP